jgi:outer membrane PBP1 activator LpoA protein
VTHTDTQLLTPLRKRRTALGLVLASVVLAGTLTACGSDADNTTCGELKGKSTDEVIDLFKDAAEGEDDQDVKDAVKAVDAFDDEKRGQFADALKAQCEGEDDDTKLKDIGN